MHIPPISLRRETFFSFLREGFTFPMFCRASWTWVMFPCLQEICFCVFFFFFPPLREKGCECPVYYPRLLFLLPFHTFFFFISILSEGACLSWAPLLGKTPLTFPPVYTSLPHFFTDFRLPLSQYLFHSDFHAPSLTFLGFSCIPAPSSPPPPLSGLSFLRGVSQSFSRLGLFRFPSLSFPFLGDASVLHKFFLGSC